MDRYGPIVIVEDDVDENENDECRDERKMLNTRKFKRN